MPAKIEMKALGAIHLVVSGFEQLEDVSPVTRHVSHAERDAKITLGCRFGQPSFDLLAVV